MKIVIIGIAVVVITAAIAFGLWEMLKPKSKSEPKCTSINPLSETDTIRRQCENIQEEDICHKVRDVRNKDVKLCQWRG